MANIFQPILGETKTPTYINPGVQDNSTAQMIGNLGQMIPGAVNAYKEYQTSKILPEIDEAITTYEEGYQGGAAAGQLGPKVDQLWEEARTDGQDNVGARIDVTTKAFEQNLAKVANAKKQGLVTETELLGRINQITREAVMKNPWLERELYNKAQGYLQQSGISDVLSTRMKSVEEGNKAAQKENEFYRTQLMEEDIVPMPGESTESLVQRLDVAVQEKRKVAVTKQFREGQIQLDAQRFHDLLKSGTAHNYHYADRNMYVKELITDMKNAGSGNEYAAVLAQYRQEATNRKMQWRAALQTGFGSDPGAKQFYEDIAADYDSTLKDLEKFTSGADAVAFLENANKALVAAQDTALREQFDVASIRFSTEILRGLMGGEKQLIGEEGAPAVKQLMMTSLGLMDPESAGQKRVTQILGSGDGNKFFDKLLTKDQPSRADIDASVLALQTFNRMYESPTTGLQELEKVQSANETLASIAKSQAGFSSMATQSPAFTREVMKTTDYVMQKVMPDLDRLMQDAMQKRPGLEMEFDILPSGAFVINSNDPEIARKFNEKFGPQINNALDAIAKSSGKGREQVGMDFFQKHFQKYLPIAPESPTSDLNQQGVPLPTPSENKQPTEAPTELQPAPVEAAPIAPPAIDPEAELRAIAKRFTELKEQYKKKQISKEEWEVRVDYLNERRKAILPNGRLFGDDVEEVVPDKKSSLDNQDMLQSLQSIVAELNKPRSILRDENGRITGVA